jgi:hypothetical protein
VYRGDLALSQVSAQENGSEPVAPLDVVTLE